MAYSRLLSSIAYTNHCHQIEDIGVKIARHLTDADVDVVRLFAILYDFRRLDNNYDPDHGRRSAKYAREMRGRLFDLDDTRFDCSTKPWAGTLTVDTSKDITISTCLDADRLDLRRLGIQQDPAYISIFRCATC